MYRAFVINHMKHMDFLDILYLYFSLHSAYCYCSIQPLAAILNKPIIFFTVPAHPGLSRTISIEP